MQFRNFSLTEFSFNNMEHYRLINNLEKEPGVHYISPKLSRFVDESVHSEEIIPGNTYVISNNNDDLIGLLGLMDLDLHGNLELWTILGSNYRGKHYASKTIGTIVPYLIEHVDGLNDIKLVINKNNTNSIRVALSNGFNEVDNDGKNKTYYYFRTK